MQLLVSVSGPAEARAALLGGADVIDAKEPRRAPLGSVSTVALAAIRRVVGSRRPVTAALGDATSAKAVAEGARRVARHHVAFVKVGFAGTASEARARVLAAAAVQDGTGLVVVAYADWERAASLAPERLIAVAADVGAAGVLIDTACKEAPLFSLHSREVVSTWVARGHAASLFAALAGGLTAADVPTVREIGADVMGTRGAACLGGRLGRVSRERVAMLVALTRAPPGAPRPAGVPALVLS